MREVRYLPGCYYSTELFDDVWGYGLVTEQETKFLLNLNLLFFESSCQGAATILSHPVLYKLCSEDPDGMKQLYSSGALMPIHLEESTSMGQVAERMIAENTHRFLHDEDLRKHASLIDDFGPKRLIDYHAEIQVEQYATIHSVLRAIEAGSVGSTLLGDPLPSSDSIMRFLKWMDSLTPQEFGVGKTHRFLDEWDKSFVDDRDRIRRTILAVHADIMRRGQGVSVSSFEGFNSSFALLSILKARDIAPVEGVEPTEGELAELDTSLPFAVIAQLELHHVLWLRNEPEFRRARQLLRAIRDSRVKRDMKVLRDALDECFGVLERFAAAGSISRERIIDALRTARVKSRIKVVVKTGSDVLIQVLSIPTGGVLLTLLGTLKDALLDKIEIPTRSALFEEMRLGESAGDRKRYDAIEGITSES